ncbi:MAG: XRE family transcriptional regulator [Clostridia bacterium]
MQHSTLIGEMAKKKITIEQIAKLLNIHRNSVANKLGGSTAFTIEEAIQIQEAFFPDCSLKELFRKEG